MIKRSRDSARKAILTNIEREYVRGKKPLNTKNKSKLFRKLDKRFEALFEDLEIIKKSKVLDIWKSTRNTRKFYVQQYELLRQIFVQVKTIYLRKIRHVGYKKIRIKKNKALLDETPQYYMKTDKYPKFWLDITPEHSDILRTDERILELENVLRGLGSKLRKECGEELLKAYTAGKIPTSREKACTLKEMKKRIV